MLSDGLHAAHMECSAGQTYPRASPPPLAAAVASVTGYGGLCERGCVGLLGVGGLPRDDAGKRGFTVSGGRFGIPPGEPDARTAGKGDEGHGLCPEGHCGQINSFCLSEERYARLSGR